ncbi:uncharacterized protein [Trachinotus anak]|uniref:uncharacterized protein n=1 Tax=Trachinotus anak TaxID=443729 RepID=UPI0039F1EF93
MKTLCVAVVVLSLTSVCQPALLACKQLLKPVDRDPDFSGRWYVIAVASNTCLLPGLLNAVFSPSIALDITSSNTPNVYNVSILSKWHGYCDNDTSSFFYGNNTLFDADNNNDTSDELSELLQSGCPDCVVTKGGDTFTILMLLSRRKTVTAAEMKEFATQTECLGWYKPEVLSTDHEYENCNSLEDDDFDFDIPEIWNMVSQRLDSVLLNCILERLLYYCKVAFGWFQQMWNIL